MIPDAVHHPAQALAHRAHHLLEVLRLSDLGMVTLLPAPGPAVADEWLLTDRAARLLERMNYCWYTGGKLILRVGRSGPPEA